MSVLPARPRGFTIVELLIVIVIIGILAAITTVAYDGIQSRARNTRRVSDVSLITKALELYYIDNGQYPSSVNPGGPGSCATYNQDDARSGCTNWDVLIEKLKPYVSTLPIDPINTLGSTTSTSQHSYIYITVSGSGWPTSCNYNPRPYQAYYLLYYQEGQQTKDVSGTCTRDPADFTHGNSLTSMYFKSQ